MFGKVGVLMGGISREKEISLKSGKAIASALKQLEIDVHEIICKGNLKKELEKVPIDIAFIALHGRYGEDGTVQMLLEEMGIPYTGSGVLASSLAINKKKSKLIFQEYDIPTPPWQTVSRDTFSTTSFTSFPVVIKPVSEGSSIGLSIAHDEKLLRRIIMSMLETKNEVLVEKYISGKELTVGILAGEPLPIIHITTQRLFYDYIAKYEKGNTEYLVPADLSPEMTRIIQQTALSAHNALGCRDMSRVDIILGTDGHPYILEINTIPGFTETSLLPKAAKTKGLTFEMLCFNILELAFSRKDYKESARK